MQRRRDSGGRAKAGLTRAGAGLRLSNDPRLAANDCQTRDRTQKEGLMKTLAQIAKRFAAEQEAATSVAYAVGMTMVIIGALVPATAIGMTTRGIILMVVERLPEVAPY